MMITIKCPHCGFFVIKIKTTQAIIERQCERCRKKLKIEIKGDSVSRLVDD